MFFLPFSVKQHIRDRSLSLEINAKFMPLMEDCNGNSLSHWSQFLAFRLCITSISMLISFWGSHTLIQVAAHTAGNTLIALLKKPSELIIYFFRATYSWKPASRLRAIKCSIIHEIDILKSFCIHQ